MMLVQDVGHTNCSAKREVQVLDRLSWLIDNIAQLDFGEFQAGQNHVSLLGRQERQNAIPGEIM
jgi:hypothetical protein